MLVYATEADLAGAPWGVTPENATSLLRAASVLVRQATRTAVYDVDATGAPTDTTVAEALRDATCAQAAAWANAGVDPTGPVRPRVKQSQSLGSGSVTYADATQVAAAVDTLRGTLTGEAALILADAGLTGGRPVVYG